MAANEPWRFAARLPWVRHPSQPSVMLSQCPEGSPAYSFVEEIFNKCPATRSGRRFHLEQVQAVRNDLLEKRFRDQYEQMENRRLAGGAFDPDVKGESHAKRRTIARLKSHFEPRPHGFEKCNTLYVWHGTGHEKVELILRSGFADMHGSDDGYFGGGIYTTTDAVYACQYATKELEGVSEPGPWRVVLASALVDTAYAVTQDDYPASSSGVVHSNLFGKSLRPGHYNHVVVVDPWRRYEAAADPLEPEGDYPEAPSTYLELVCKQDTQLLPLFVVEVGVDP